VALIIGVVLGVVVNHWWRGRGDTTAHSLGEGGGEGVEASAEAPDNASPSIRIGFSCPESDDSWLLALGGQATRAATELGDVELLLRTSASTPEEQISGLGQLLDEAVDALVVFSHAGGSLSSVCSRARRSDVPVINVGPPIPTEDFLCHVDGDNYGIGVAAARFLAAKLGGYGKVLEITGAVGPGATEDRSRGFHETLAVESRGVKVIGSASGESAADRALIATEGLLEEHTVVDAVFSHSDEMNVGVLQAVIAAGREDELFITGVGGSRWALRQIQRGQSPVCATFLYSPTMAGCAMRLARLAAQGKGLPDLEISDIPRRINLQPVLVTRENVESFLLLAY
ncbi:MAG: substrate-binding domain-containing protein, partial [Lentisphaerae bacterium]|nr:substrate-binding domain-containing protein [Lentisphaerota bacterium]